MHRRSSHLKNMVAKLGLTPPGVVGVATPGFPTALSTPTHRPFLGRPIMSRLPVTPTGGVSLVSIGLPTCREQILGLSLQSGDPRRQPGRRLPLLRRRSLARWKDRFTLVAAVKARRAVRSSWDRQTETQKGRKLQLLKLEGWCSQRCMCCSQLPNLLHVMLANVTG